MTVNELIDFLLTLPQKAANYDVIMRDFKELTTPRARRPSVKPPQCEARLVAWNTWAARFSHSRKQMNLPSYEYCGDQRKLTFDLDTEEDKRVYLFPGGDKVEIEGVTECQVSRHGNHQLKTGAGVVHIVPWGWICLTIPSESNVTPKEFME